ncbi:hypothetical protein [Carnobacterium sp.]|uniref:hypothetical protein n=1 Tax=Carnobacterium sp. TaxID=48221 RepID=UPI003890B6AF
MDILNIYSKEIQILKHSIYISNEDLYKIEGVTKIELIFHHEKDKRKHLALSTGKVSQKTINQNKEE